MRCPVRIDEVELEALPCQCLSEQHAPCSRQLLPPLQCHRVLLKAGGEGIRAGPRLHPTQHYRSWLRSSHGTLVAPSGALHVPCRVGTSRGTRSSWHPKRHLSGDGAVVEGLPTSSPTVVATVFATCLWCASPGLVCWEYVVGSDVDFHIIYSDIGVLLWTILKARYLLKIRHVLVQPTREHLAGSEALASLLWLRLCLDAASHRDPVWGGRWVSTKVCRSVGAHRAHHDHHVPAALPSTNIEVDNHARPPFCIGVYIGVLCVFQWDLRFMQCVGDVIVHLDLYMSF